MLVVRVELWPLGDPDGAEELGRAGIVNVTGGGESSDYLVVRLDRRGRHDSEVSSHARSEGFWELVHRAVVADVAPPDHFADGLRKIAERLDHR